MRLDHAVARHPEGEDVAALGGQPLGAHGNHVFPLLDGEDGRSGGDLAQDGNVLVAPRAL
jgi:hypothetical protein